MVLASLITIATTVPGAACVMPTSSAGCPRWTDHFFTDSASVSASGLDCKVCRTFGFAVLAVLSSHWPLHTPTFDPSPVRKVVGSSVGMENTRVLGPLGVVQLAQLKFCPVLENVGTLLAGAPEPTQ